MARRFDPDNTDKCLQTTNWNLCVICQDSVKNDNLVNPLHDSYKTFEENLNEFQNLGLLPQSMNLIRFCEDQKPIWETLYLRKAKWHKSCRLKYSGYTLGRQRVRIEAVEVEKRKRDKCSPLKAQNEPKTKFTRSQSCLFPESPTTSVVRCFFCDEIAEEGTYHEVMSLTVSKRILNAATLLQDRRILSKLALGDMVATEAKYHRQCLLTFDNRLRSQNRTRTSDGGDQERPKAIHMLVIGEIINMIEESRYEGVYFRLADILNQYTSSLESYGFKHETRLNSTRLKETLLTSVDGLAEFPQGRDVYLAFRENVGVALDAASELQKEEDIAILGKAARILRRDLFTKRFFTPTFDLTCQMDSISPKLISFVRMTLNGPNLRNDSVVTNPELSIAQLITFNSVKKQRNITEEKHRLRYNSNQETPLPIYVAMLIHCHGGSKQNVDDLHDLGLCVSYDRLLHLRDIIMDAVTRRYEEDGVVCPITLRKGVFTTAAGDNIDQNTSATFSQQSFHGNVLSLFQPLAPDEEGQVRLPIEVATGGLTERLISNPVLDAYYDVEPCPTPPKGMNVPTITDESSNLTFSSNYVDGYIIQEQETWIKCAMDSLKKEALCEDENISWGAFHAGKCNISSPGISAICPVSEDPAHSIATICHQLRLYIDQLAFLNPGQTAVICYDQPLYKIVKELQWMKPELYGEGKLFAMMGILHIEMAVDKMIADVLASSGWAGALTHAGIFTSGRSESLECGANVNRSRYAQQVTLVALEELKRRAFTKYIDENDVNHLDYKLWVKKRTSDAPQFAFWDLAARLISLNLLLVRSVRERIYPLYVAVLTTIMPFFFALDHQNYARWGAVHVRDLNALPRLSPDVYTQFMSGKFNISTTGNPFSAIPFDQANEYNIEKVKVSGGFCDLTLNAVALKKSMVVTPEIMRMIQEFRRAAEKEQVHHEMNTRFQMKFHSDVKSLISTLDEWGSPFESMDNMLFALDTRRVADDDVVIAVRSMEATGIKDYNKFVDERFVKRSKPIDEPIHQNKLRLFSSPIKTQSKSKLRMKFMKADQSLFSRLYMGCKNRTSDLDTFFKHENQPFPPSLSDGGDLRLGTKSDIVSCITGDVEGCSVTLEAPITDAKVLEGSVLVHLLKPKKGSFGDYARDVFCPYVKKQFTRGTERIDIVFDVYKEDSLKNSTRERRGTSAYRSNIDERAVVPVTNWPNFLQSHENKEQLFRFLAQSIVQEVPDHMVVVNAGQTIMSSKPVERIEELMSSNHEEADTRVILHAMHQAKSNAKAISIRTVDSDVVVLAVAFFEKLSVSELYITYGQGKNFRYIPVHEIANSLGPQRSEALLFFHAFTGCDTVSAFAWHGKGCAWKAWKSAPAITETFQKLSTTNEDLTEEHVQNLQRFVIIMYDRTSGKTDVNKLRKHLFTKRCSLMERLPPTQDALELHVRRAYLQAQIWSTSHLKHILELDPSDFGWRKLNGTWRPYWMNLPEASAACRELIHCGCKTGCSESRCVCKNSGLLCTDLCTGCQGSCT